LEAGKILSTGRTRPMIIRGACVQTGIKAEYVVKLKGSDEMYPGSSLNEILASLIAMEMGFLTPEPVIVNITDEFLETMKHRHGNYMIASKSLGFNFGSSLEKGFQEVIPGQVISKELKEKLLDLFAFDVFIGNTDRRVDKPNFLSNGKDCLIFDHELAFSFVRLLSFARNPNPWLILEADLQWLSNNFCFNHLKGNNFDFSNFATRLSVIDQAFWGKALSVIPGEWQTEQFDIIKAYLERIIENKNGFVSELNRVLL